MYVFPCEVTLGQSRYCKKTFKNISNFRIKGGKWEVVLLTKYWQLKAPSVPALHPTLSTLALSFFSSIIFCFLRKGYLIKIRKLRMGHSQRKYKSFSTFWQKWIFLTNIYTTLTMHVMLSVNYTSLSTVKL